MILISIILLFVPQKKSKGQYSSKGGVLYKLISAYCGGSRIRQECAGRPFKEILLEYINTSNSIQLYLIHIRTDPIPKVYVWNCM